MTDFGSDVSTFPDLDPSFSTLTGPRVVAEAIARRLSTPRGSLPFYPDYGIDIRSWVNETITRGKLAQFRRDLEAECVKDERVLTADASLAFNVKTNDMQIAITITTADGPFSLVLGVTAVTVALLTVSPQG